MGRVFYLLLKFEPIDFAAYDDTKTAQDRIAGLIELGEAIQNRINDGSM